MRESTIKKKVGATIRKKRAALGLSQESLAEEASIHRNHVGAVERGEASPSVCKFAKIAKALGLTASELLEEAGVWASTSLISLR